MHPWATKKNGKEKEKQLSNANISSQIPWLGQSFKEELHRQQVLGNEERIYTSTAQSYSKQWVIRGLTGKDTYASPYNKTSY